jgi:hypothetical protein
MKNVPARNKGSAHDSSVDGQLAAAEGPALGTISCLKKKRGVL